MARRPKGSATTPLTNKLFISVEPDNAEYVKEILVPMFGSQSAAINALIAKERGVKPALGSWKSPGEAKALRQGDTNVPVPEKPASPAEKFQPGGGPGTRGYRDPVL